MMRIKRYIWLLLVALTGASAVAQSLGPNGQYSASVVLERDDVPHLFWLKGYLPTASFQSLTVEATYNTTNEVGETVSRTLVPYESMETHDSKGRVTGFYVLLTEDDWAKVPEEKSSLTFVATVRGRYDAENKYNNMFDLGHESGREHYPDPVTEGSTEDNPYWIMPQPEERFVDCDSTNRYFSGTFYLSVDLKAEHRYMFGIADADYPVTMRLKGSTNDLLAAAQSYTNALEWTDCANAWTLVPPCAGTYVFEVKSGRGKFRFKHAVMPDRLPAQHEHGMLRLGYPVEFVPGYLVNPTNGFCDGVVDECLFEFSDFSARDRYVFRTTGAATNLLMRLYDAQGNVLATNYWVCAGSNDVQLTWSVDDLKASCGTSLCVNANAVYVGVCQRLAEGEAPTSARVTLSVSRCGGESVPLPLTAVPDPNERSPFEAADAEPSPACTLNVTNWSQVFVVQARAGITYRVKARLETNDTHAAISGNGLALAVRAYTMSGSTKKDLPDGSVVGAECFDPSSSSTNWMEFVLADHKAVYLEVSVADGAWGSGRGLAYGPYSVCVTAESDEGHEYGVLKADMLGAAAADMGWKILSGPATAGIRANAEPYYPAGGSVILPPGGPYQIAARPISGFQRPDAHGYASVYVENGKLVKAPRYEYYDTFDPADDDPSKGAKLSPSGGIPLDASRSFWADDPVDWFVLKAEEGAFYRFSLPWKNEGGDAEVRVFGPNGWTEECAYNVYADPASAVRIVAEKGTYYVRVTHAAESKPPVDGAYTLQTLMMKPGVLKLARNSISVKETAGYADVVVSRTGKNGRIRVRYRTEPIAAVPGQDYYHQEGEFVWENGDASARTVRVKLIPRTVTEKRGEERSFRVVFWTACWDEIDPENEYIPAFDSKMGDVAYVSVTETGKERPGSIRVAGTRTPKAPSFEVSAAGEVGVTRLVVPFERVNGLFGTVGVSVEAADGTAVNGRDYVFAGEDLVWADGEREVRNAVVDILPSSDDAAVKTFKLKLKALKEYGRAGLASSSVSVSIRNDRFSRTVADFAKALPKTAGYSVKESRAGTWFVREDGSWFGSGPLAFTLVGPCLFRYSVDGQTFVEVRVAAGEKARTVRIPACDGLVWEYLFFEGRAVELVQGVRHDEQVADASVDAVGVASGGKLPDGLKLEREETDGTWHVRGIPVKAGNFYARLQDGAKAEIGEVAYVVNPIRSAAGDFMGLARTEDTQDKQPRLAQVSMSATDKGKLSAKVVIAGRKYSFAADGYAGWKSAADGSRELFADLIQLQEVSRGGGKVNVTNRLRCTVADADVADPASWYGKGTSLALEMAALPDAQGSGYQKHVGYVGELVRDNSKVREWQTEASGYSAYYTVAFVPSGIPQVPAGLDDGCPRGNGYVTLTVDAKGKVKYAGALPDGTSYSGSSVAALGTVGGVPVVRLPLFFSKGAGAFGGWVAVKFPEGRVPSGNIAETDAELRPTVVADESDGICWITDDTTLTFKGQLGFELAYDAVGGWYDTVVNLQRYYLDMSVDQLIVDTAHGDDLWQLRELLPFGFDFVADATADGLPVDMSVNLLLTDKQTLAQDSTKSYYDWPRCVNPANVKLNFKRATGVFSGTCDLWYEGLDEKGGIDQKSYSKCKHAGVVLMTRGECASLPGEVVAPGAVVIPQTILLPNGYTYTWKSSHRFNIRATAIPR